MFLLFLYYIFFLPIHWNFNLFLLFSYVFLYFGYEKKNENSQIILNECVRHVRKYYIKKEDKSTRKRNHKQRINVVMEETSDFR